MIRVCIIDNTGHTSIELIITTQQTRGIHQMLFQCWASVEDGGPTLKQHWMNVSCLPGMDVSKKMK